MDMPMDPHGAKCLFHCSLARADKGPPLSAVHMQCVCYLGVWPD